LSTAIELPEMPKRQLADRILDEILSLRRPKPMMVELEGGSPQDEVLNQSASPAASRRQLIVE
jgi:phosphopantothenoylcysteine decarboxylase/phosphopantothenate--cysteine ligase